jgi:hypothetical protein
MRVESPTLSQKSMRSNTVNGMSQTRYQVTTMQVLLMATRSRVFIYGVIDCSAEAPGFRLNPVFRHCDPMEACAHGASMTGMKPS